MRYQKGLLVKGVCLSACLGLVLVVAGCGGGSSSTSSSTQLTTLTPAPQGELSRLTWALPGGEPASLDPAKVGDTSEATVDANLCENLLQTTPDFGTKPNLATKLRWTDPKTLVIDLRPGVKFWDDKPVTAADAVYSLRRNGNPKIGVNAEVFANVTRIEATGPLQVTIHFKAHDSAFVESMSIVAGSVYEKEFAEEAGSDFGTAAGGLMCSGPYELGNWVPGEEITISRNDGYWNTGLEPKTKEVVFRFISDSSTLTTALLSGAVDGSYGVPVGSVNSFERSGSGTLYQGGGTEYLAFGPLNRQTPAANEKIRQALSFAIDREAFIENQLGGAGEIQKSFVGPFDWSQNPAKAIYDSGYEQIPYPIKPDIEKAMKLVAEAGAPSKTMTIALAAGNQLLTQLATLIQAAAKEIGLKIAIHQLQPTEYSELFYSKAAQAKIDMVLAEGYTEIPNPLGFASSFVLPYGVFNTYGYEDPTVTKELEAARVAESPQEAAKHFVAAERVFVPQNPVITVASLHTLLYMNSNITGAPATISYVSTPWAAYVGSAK